jgi:hypothetical protein
MPVLLVSFMSLAPAPAVLEAFATLVLFAPLVEAVAVAVHPDVVRTFVPAAVVIVIVDHVPRRRLVALVNLTAYDPRHTREH